MADQKNYHLLLIDQDLDEAAMLVETALEPFGYDVEAVSSGDEALSLAELTHYDLIILDLHLAGLSGLDVLVALNAQGGDTPVVLLADEGAHDDALHAFRLGARDYVMRPIREAELIQVIERVLSDVRLPVEAGPQVADVQPGPAPDLDTGDLRAVVEAGRSLAAQTTARGVAQELAEIAAAITGAEAAGVYLISDETGEPHLRAGVGLHPVPASRIGGPVTDDLADTVLSSGQAALYQQPDLAGVVTAQPGATTVIYAPITVRNQNVGVLFVANQHYPLTQADLDLVVVLAGYAASALVGAWVVAELLRRTRRAQTVELPPADARCRQLARNIRDPLAAAAERMELFRSGAFGELPIGQQAAVDVLARELNDLVSQVDGLVPTSPADA